MLRNEENCHAFIDDEVQGGKIIAFERRVAAELYSNNESRQKCLGNMVAIKL